MKKSSGYYMPKDAATLAYLRDCLDQAHDKAMDIAMRGFPVPLSVEKEIADLCEEIGELREYLERTGAAVA